MRSVQCDTLGDVMKVSERNTKAALQYASEKTGIRWSPTGYEGHPVAGCLYIHGGIEKGTRRLTYDIGVQLFINGRFIKAGVASAWENGRLIGIGVGDCKEERDLLKFREFERAFKEWNGETPRMEGLDD